MSEGGRFFKDITRLDRSAFSFPIGVRGAAFVIAPMVVGVVFQEQAFVLSTLGALFLTNTEGQPSVLPWRVLLVACFTEAAAFGVGTLAATTGPFAPLLLGVGVSVALLARGSPRWANAGTFTAVAFAVGAGLPGSSVEAAALRLSFSLGGALLALLGVGLHRLALSRRHAPGQVKAAFGQPMSGSEALRSAVLLGIVSALGFAIGDVLGLPRDFWVVVTIVISVRPSVSLTLSFTSMMAIGTIIGAFMAAAITLETGDVYVLLPLLFAFAILMFASRGVNFGLVQVFLTPFIIILINILYPGDWYLALYRILEVFIGVVLAIIAVYLLSTMKKGKGNAPKLLQLV
jgi:fusaric acid resistance family protein